MKKTVAIILALLLALPFAACGKQTPEQLAGVWEYHETYDSEYGSFIMNDVVLRIYGDGTYLMTTDEYTAHGTISTHPMQLRPDEGGSLDFSLQDEKLTLSGVTLRKLSKAEAASPKIAIIGTWILTESSDADDAEFYGQTETFTMGGTNITAGIAPCGYEVNGNIITYDTGWGDGEDSTVTIDGDTMVIENEYGWQKYTRSMENVQPRRGTDW